MSEQEQYEWKELAEKYLAYDWQEHLRQIELTVKDGWVDALKAYLVLYNLEKEAARLKSEILELAVSEVSEYEKGREIDGFKLEKINSAGRWNYSKVKEWNDKKESLKEYEKKLQSSFRAWEKGIEMFDNETGEKVPPAAYIPGKETIKVTKLK